VTGVLAVLIAVPALAGDAPVGYVHESWTIEDGLPVNGIKKLIQPRDGYLWMATFDLGQTILKLCYNLTAQ